QAYERVQRPGHEVTEERDAWAAVPVRSRPDDVHGRVLDTAQVRGREARHPRRSELRSRPLMLAQVRDRLGPRAGRGHGAAAATRSPAPAGGGRGASELEAAHSTEVLVQDGCWNPAETQLCRRARSRSGMVHPRRLLQQPRRWLTPVATAYDREATGMDQTRDISLEGW